MFSKFIEPWLLPPGLFVVALAVAAFGLRRFRNRRTAKATLLVLSATLYLLSTEAAARVVLGSLERAVPHVGSVQMAAADAVVVLGGGVKTGAFTPDGQPAAVLAAEAQARLVHGYLIARDLNLPIVVSGGRVLDDERVPAEAVVASETLRRLGMPAEAILTEERSRTTFENARFVRESFGFERVILVTSAYHMPRSLFSFAAAGLDALPAPTAFRTDQRPFQPYMLLPNARALHDTATAFRERLGMLWYRLLALRRNEASV